MPWRGHLGKTCKVCLRPVSECGSLSARYKCQECRERRVTENLYNLHYRSGPFFEAWYAACRAAFEFDRSHRAQR